MLPADMWGAFQNRQPFSNLDIWITLQQKSKGAFTACPPLSCQGLLLQWLWTGSRSRWVTLQVPGWHGNLWNMHSQHPESEAVMCSAIGWDTDISVTAMSSSACHSYHSILAKLWLSLFIFKEDSYSLIYVLSISVHYVLYPTPDYPGNLKVGWTEFWHNRKQPTSATPNSVL